MTNSSVSPSKGLEQARQYYASGNLDEARKAIEGVLRAEPNNVDALLLAADVYRQSNPQVAFKVYARAAQLAPQRPEAPAGLALLYHDQGNVPQCDKCLDAVIGLDPEYLRTHYYSSMAAAVQRIKRGRESAPDKMVDFYDSIAAAYQRGVERYPVSPLVSFNLARVLFVLGEPELARQAYQRCLELDPEMTEAYAGMVEASFALELYEETVEWAALAEGRTWRVTGDQQDPVWVAARLAAGDVLQSRVYRVDAKARLWMGQFEKMTQAIRRAAEAELCNSADLYRDMLDEHVKLGRALLENNQLSEAISVLEVGRDMARTMEYHALFLWLAEAYLARALAYSAAKDRRQAEDWLAQASEIANHPPVPVPPEASTAWDGLKARLTLGGKTSPFGFLRK